MLTFSLRSSMFACILFKTTFQFSFFAEIQDLRSSTLSKPLSLSHWEKKGNIPKMQIQVTSMGMKETLPISLTWELGWTMPRREGRTDKLELSLAESPKSRASGRLDPRPPSQPCPRWSQPEKMTARNGFPRMTADPYRFRGFICRRLFLLRFWGNGNGFSKQTLLVLFSQELTYNKKNTRSLCALRARIILQSVVHEKEPKVQKWLD